MPTPSAVYAAARFYLMLEAFVEGELRPSHAELDWAIDLLDTLDLPEEILADAEADHHRMLADAPAPASRR